MLGAETEEKLFDAPLSISKSEQLEQQVELMLSGRGDRRVRRGPPAPLGLSARGPHAGPTDCRDPCSPPHVRPLTLQVPENYFYVPDLGQVPEIDVPSYLPDLPGIADDLMYSADLGPGIAPSAPGTIPELPTFHTEVAEPFKPSEREPGMGSWATFFPRHLTFSHLFQT